MVQLLVGADAQAQAAYGLHPVLQSCPSPFSPALPDGLILDNTFASHD